MNVVDIPERNIRVEYPAAWEEMNDRQFGCVMQNWLKLADGKINIDEFMLIVLYNFLGIRRGPFQNWKDKRMTREQLEEKFSNILYLTGTLDWLIREEKTADGIVGVLNYAEVKNRIPEIENDAGVTLTGPVDCMLDITFGEYRRAWACFEAYSKNKKDIDLDRLIAVLYRPVQANHETLKHDPGFDGSRREHFNPHLTDHYAGMLCKVPFWKKYVIYCWFFNCDRFLKEEELELEGRALSFAPLFSKRQIDDGEVENLGDSDLGLTGLLYMIAESNMFGGPAQVDNTNYIDLLTALLYWKQQTDKIKKI